MLVKSASGSAQEVLMYMGVWIKLSQRFITSFQKTFCLGFLWNLEGKIRRSIKNERQNFSWIEMIEKRKEICMYFQNIFGGSTNLSRSVSVHSSQSGWSTSPLLEIMSNNSAVFFNLLPKETFWPASPTKVNPWLLFWALLKCWKSQNEILLCLLFQKKQEKVFSLFLPLPLKCCRIKIKKNIVLTSVPLLFVVNTVLILGRSPRYIVTIE